MNVVKDAMQIKFTYAYTLREVRKFSVIILFVSIAQSTNMNGLHCPVRIIVINRANVTTGKYNGSHSLVRFRLRKLNALLHNKTL